MPPPAAVLFDNDGLLLDTESLWTRAERAMYRDNGVEFTIEHKRDLIGTAGAASEAIIARHLGQPARGVELHAELKERVMLEIGHGVEPMPGALALLARVREAGLKHGLASNSPRVFVDAVLDAAGLRGAFAVVLSIDDVAHGKPAPDLYLALAQRLGTSAGDCVALEDSPTGVAAATAAGAFTIGVPSLDGVVLDGADLVCPSLEDPRVATALGLSAA